MKDAPVILLDESTASIDPENETKIQEAIGKLIEDKTVLIIAHKLRSIVECDKIVVLKEGHLVEEGTHNELMKQSGLYHRLYSLQNESMDWGCQSTGIKVYSTKKGNEHEKREEYRTSEWKRLVKCRDFHGSLLRIEPACCSRTWINPGKSVCWCRL